MDLSTIRRLSPKNSRQSKIGAVLDPLPVACKTTQPSRALIPRPIVPKFQAKNECLTASHKVNNGGACGRELPLPTTPSVCAVAISMRGWLFSPRSHDKIPNPTLRIHFLLHASTEATGHAQAVHHAKPHPESVVSAAVRLLSLSPPPPSPNPEPLSTPRSRRCPATPAAYSVLAADACGSLAPAPAPAAAPTAPEEAAPAGRTRRRSAVSSPARAAERRATHPFSGRSPPG